MAGAVYACNGWKGQRGGPGPDGVHGCIAKRNGGTGVNREWCGTGMGRVMMRGLQCIMSVVHVRGGTRMYESST